MSPETFPPRTRRAPIDDEEMRAWVGIYRRAQADATLAAEVLAQLDQDPEAKRAHLALYLCCRQCLRLQKARQQRQRRLRQFLRWLGHRLMAAPAAAGPAESPRRIASDTLRPIPRNPGLARDPTALDPRRPSPCAPVHTVPVPAQDAA